MYRHMHLALYAAYRGDEAGMIDHLRQFSEEDNYQYWILFFKDDTMVAPFTGNPAFKAAFDTIEDKFWKNNKQVRATLEEKGLL